MKIAKLLPLFISLSIIFISCNNNEKNNNNTQIADTNKVEVVNSELTVSGEFFVENDISNLKIGDKILIDFKIEDEIKLDSLVFFINNNYILSTENNIIQYNFDSKSYKVGVQNFKIIAYKDKKSKSFEKMLTFKSDIIPQKLNYKVVKSYNHDENAYTQGLVFYKGVFFEATGLETKSSLRKVKLENGEIIQSFVLPNNIFGEGITIFNDKIIQVSWQDKLGFVYDINSFDIIQQFTYNTEGWGLTNDDTKLYMSDGTNIIYVLDPNNFMIIDKIQVYDNSKPVKYLNELEFINGKIYANIYLTDDIAIIDPSNGKVDAYVNLAGILPSSMQSQKTDVLNGIAYDKEKNRIFVTGKNWKLLFEITIK
jgi:glutamine cyclotransferase